LPPTRLMTSARISEHQVISVACQGKALYAWFPRIAAPWIILPAKKALAANAVCQPRTANQPMDPQASAISSHHRLLRANRRLTCDETNELHVFGRGKHGCPVVLAASGRGPIFVVSSRSSMGVNRRSSRRIHRGQFGQNHEIGEGAYPAENVGVDGTAGAATGNTCQRVQWS
jgi:hypothetical protein